MSKDTSSLLADPSLEQGLPPSYDSIVNFSEPPQEMIRFSTSSSVPKYLRYLISLVFIMFVGFMGINCALVLPHMEDYINKSLDLTVQEINFAGLGKGFSTINLDVKVDTLFDYNRIKNNYVTHILSSSSSFLQTVDILLDEIEIKTKNDGDDVDGDPITKLGYLSIPEFRVRISPNTTTHLSLPLAFKPNKKELFDILRKISDKMQKGEKEIILNVMFDTYLKLNLGYVPIWKKFAINVDKRIELHKFFKNFDDFLSILVKFILKEGIEGTNEFDDNKDSNFNGDGRIVELGTQVINNGLNLNAIIALLGQT